MRLRSYAKRRHEPEPREKRIRVFGIFRGVLYSVGAFRCVINVLLLVPSLYRLQVYDRLLASRDHVTLHMRRDPQK